MAPRAPASRNGRHSHAAPADRDGLGSSAGVARFERGRPVRLAVVGVGYWGPNVVRCAAGATEIELAAVCDLEPDRLATMARLYPQARTTARVEDVIGDPEIEAVVVATPVSSHYPLVRACLDVGKHVLVEKPLAGSSAEAVDLIDRAERRGLVLVPGHTFLYSPPVAYVRELIAAGELGELLVVSMSRVNLGIHQPDVSVLWDLAPHDFSILLYWLNELPVEITALGRDCVVNGIPDVAFVNLRFASGLVAHVELAWLAPCKLRRTTVVGSRKMVVYDDTSVEPVRVFDAGVELRAPGQRHLSYRTGDILTPRLDTTEPLAAELSDFCVAIRTGSAPRSTMTLGRDVVLMIEQTQHALTSGRSVEQMRTVV
jgi:predicted dehydrogenase